MKTVSIILLCSCVSACLPRGASVDVSTIGGGVRLDRSEAPTLDPMARERDISACAGVHEIGSPQYCGCLRRNGAAGDHEYVAFCQQPAPASARARGPPPDMKRVAGVVEKVVRHEGAPALPYVDPSGRCHQAIGDAYPAPGACDRLIANLLAADNVASRVAGDLWGQLTENQRRGLLMLTFGVGERGLQGFVSLLAALRGGYGHAAADEIRNSLWCRQVGEARCGDVATLMTQ